MRGILNGVVNNCPVRFDHSVTTLRPFYLAKKGLFFFKLRILEKENDMDKTLTKGKKEKVRFNKKCIEKKRERVYS